MESKDPRGSNQCHLQNLPTFPGWIADNSTSCPTKIYQILHEGWSQKNGCTVLQLTDSSTRRSCSSPTPRIPAPCLAEPRALLRAVLMRTLLRLPRFFRRARQKQDPTVVATTVLYTRCGCASKDHGTYGSSAKRRCRRCNGPVSQGEHSPELFRFPLSTFMFDKTLAVLRPWITAVGCPLCRG